MNRVMSVGRFAGWSVAAVVVAMVTTVELLVAADLLATADYSGWHNWPLGLVYAALVALIAVRVATKRASIEGGMRELLALDFIALPVVLAVLSM